MTVSKQNYTPPSTVQLIFGDGTPKKALVIAFVVGSVLTAINHGDLLLSGSTPPIWKILLTFCVPYCVATWGAVTGKRAQWSRDNEEIADISFFNFRNAITAAYFADEDLKVKKVNENFFKFFPVLDNIAASYFPDVLKQLGVPEAQIVEFTDNINDKGFVLIPEIHINIKGEERVFSLLSTRTQDEDFSYLKGVQGQFIDRTDEWRLRRERDNEL
ncbi:hypothetical protein A9Q83_02630 [Alphaproteobacteria bacterium 46_93_T64]|nr:hypothetical protein A9Q83_02630 [Alphaproteobacteria bacterium 46_93_T64]